MASKPEIDFLKPETIWIRNRCYRVLAPNSERSAVNYAEEDDILDYDNYGDDLECDQGESEDVRLEYLKNGKVQATLPIASFFMPFLIGSKGQTKKRIENDTYTQIKIPPRGQSGDVVVIGKDGKSVRQAVIMVELLVSQARKKQPFTHFFSVPCNTKQIRDQFLKFKAEVLENCGHCRGVDSSIFQSPERLHITICVATLMDDRERREVGNVLEDLKGSINEYFPGISSLRLNIKGLEYMNDDPGEVDVLYAKVEADSWTFPTQEFFNFIKVHMVNRDVSHQQTENVKLHITLMNTLFRSETDGLSADTSSEATDRVRESFDAKEILEVFRNYEFGEIDVDEIHLSVRYSKSASGYYSHTAKINLFSDS